MSVRAVTGDDPALLAETVSTVIEGILAGQDRSLALEYLDETTLRNPDGDPSLAPLVDAAQTQPFLTPRRVVAARHLARFAKPAQVADLVNLVQTLPASTDLVLVWERGADPPMTGRFPTFPKKLAEAVRGAGGDITNVNPPTRKSDAAKWLAEQLAGSSLRFGPAAAEAVGDLLGEDRGNIVGLLRTLEGALGSDAAVTAEDVAVYGGEAGSVPPWDLDDAIDRGDIAAALDVLHRLLGSRHPMQLLAVLHNRYQKMLRLDGAGAADERQAAQILEMKGSTFPARKILAQTRKLGSAKVARCIRLLADADLALRGTLDWPDELVMEVLVARLAALSKR